MGLRDLITAELEVEELLQFLYLMPVAVARLGTHAEVEMLNPKMVQLLHDLDIDVGHANGIQILDDLLPGLSQRWRKSVGDVGSIMAPLPCTPPRAGHVALHLLIHLVRPDHRCTMLVIEDVTTTVEQEREISRQRHRMGVVLEHIHGYCAVMLDAAGKVIEWNPSIGRMFGVAESGFVGHPMLDHVTTDAQDLPSVPTFHAIEKAVALQGWCRLHAPWRKADGQVLWGDCVFTPVIESDGLTSGYVTVIRDVTEEHRHTRKLLDAALTDPLTGLYNRRGLEHRAEALQARPGGAPTVQTWIMADIDHFKRVNDSYGHDGGDVVLKVVAAALQSTARDGDVVARLGGEEFVLLLPDANASAAAGVAERLRLKLEALAIDAAGRTIRVTASFGIAQQRVGEPSTAALERADAALYCAKHEGRNAVRVSDHDGES